MRLICRGRAGGKTIEAIKCSAKIGAHIICFNDNERKRIVEMAREIDLDIPRPITFEEFKSRAYCGKEVRRFVIDNVDEFLQSFTSIPIEAITLNGGWQNELKQFDECSEMGQEQWNFLERRLDKVAFKREYLGVFEPTEET